MFKDTITEREYQTRIGYAVDWYLGTVERDWKKHHYATSLFRTLTAPLGVYCLYLTTLNKSWGLKKVL